MPIDYEYSLALRHLGHMHRFWFPPIRPSNTFQTRSASPARHDGKWFVLDIEENDSKLLPILMRAPTRATMIPTMTVVIMKDVGSSVAPGDAESCPDGDAFVECTIVQLGSQAGTLKSNIQRWLGQLGMEVGDDMAGSPDQKRPPLTKVCRCTNENYSSSDECREGIAA